MDTMLLRTTVVGSYPQPDWLINRESLGKQVPRMRAPELWRIAEPWLEQAQDDATIVAIHEMESAGIDIVTARCVVRVTRTASPIRSKASIPLASAKVLDALVARPFLSRSLLDEFAVPVRSKCAISNFFARTPHIK
jgi:hypothetical protein